MSSSDRRTFLGLLAAAPLAGCGFSPVYAPGGAGLVLRDRVEVAAPDDRLGFVLVSRLEERLGQSASPDYVLNYVIETRESGLAITGTNDITRINLTGRVAFTVTEALTGVQVHAGSVSSFSAYSTTGSTVATATAERDAEDRLMTILADQMMSRLMASAGRWT